MSQELHQSDHPRGTDPVAPPPLAAALRDRFGASPGLPPHVDDAVMSSYRSAMAARGRRRALVRRVLTGGGIAAAVALAAGGVLWIMGAGVFGPRGGKTIVAAAVTGDVNGDGVVDIADALLLARQLDARQLDDGASAAGRTRQLDMNGDGSIDRADVDAIAYAAVDLSAWKGAS